jgi:hypothetical protein
LLPAIALASVLAASAAYLAPVTGHTPALLPGARDTGEVPPAGIPPPSGSPSVGSVSVGSVSGGSGSGGVSGGSGGFSGGAVAVRYGFEGEGHLAMRVHAAAGGAVRTESRGGGLAVRFPPPCPQYGDPACPRAILETSFAANPGTGPLRFGATVRLAANETSEGENVLQKGFSQGHSQFKLQVDGASGQPSCVLVGTSSPHIFVATTGVSVANGQWRAVECVRTGSSLTVLVDGTVAGRANVPTELSIVNNDPLRIGGKGTSANNDQYHGALDDVFVSIGCGVSC